jgi:DNA adenine methylase
VSTLFDAGPEMKITAIAPWFGGKRTLAPVIVRELGKHTVYWEPFCGSMAVLLEKPQCQSETVNDLNGDVTNLARVVASDDGPILFERLSRTMFAEALVGEAKERRREGGLSNLDSAYWFFVESWMGRNGVAGTRASNTAFCVRYTSNGGDSAVRFKSAVSSIPAWAHRLTGVTVLTRDGFEILERIEDKPGTVIYCDPPYFSKGAKYVHDFEADDHERLASLLSRFKKTRVVVSYYAHDRLKELYPDWTVTRLKETKAMVNQGMRDKKGATDAPECLIINGPSYVGAT